MANDCVRKSVSLSFVLFTLYIRQTLVGMQHNYMQCSKIFCKVASLFFSWDCVSGTPANHSSHNSIAKLHVTGQLQSLMSRVFFSVHKQAHYIYCKCILSDIIIHYLQLIAIIILVCSKKMCSAVASIWQMLVYYESCIFQHSAAVGNLKQLIDANSYQVQAYVMSH